MSTIKSYVSSGLMLRRGSSPNVNIFQSISCHLQTVSSTGLGVLDCPVVFGV
jgi:hypothetical protein